MGARDGVLRGGGYDMRGRGEKKQITSRRMVERLITQVMPPFGYLSDLINNHLVFFVLFRGSSPKCNC